MIFMKIGTRTVTPKALDWLVAMGLYADSETHTPSIVEGKVVIQLQDYDGNPMGEHDFSPTEDWAIGGPIVEQLMRDRGLLIEAVDANYRRLPAFKATLDQWSTAQFGPTWLTTGLLAYAASVQGEHAEVPDELFALT